jgi:phosphoribosylaminoimidazole carboxylase (NCAIR synthetase)
MRICVFYLYECTSICREFASICDIIFVEADDVSAETVLELESLCSEVSPSSAALSILSDQLVQKSFFKSNGFQTPGVYEIDSVESAFEAGYALGYPFIIRDRVLGLQRESVLEEAGVAAALALTGTERVYAERSPACAQVLHVTLVQGRRGERFTYPIAEDLRSGIYVAPASISTTVENAARTLAEQAVDALGSGEYCGIFVVKMLLLEDNTLCLEGVSARYITIHIYD